MPSSAEFRWRPTDECCIRSSLGELTFRSCMLRCAVTSPSPTLRTSPSFQSFAFLSITRLPSTINPSCFANGGQKGKCSSSPTFSATICQPFWILARRCLNCATDQTTIMTAARTTQFNQNRLDPWINLLAISQLFVGISCSP